MVLAVHAATRHGAFLSAFEMLNAVRPIVTERVVVLRHGGELEAEFRRAASAVEFEPFRGLSKAMQSRPRTAALKRRIGFDLFAARTALRRLRPSVVYASNLGVGAYAAAGVQLGIPTVLHVREVSPRIERAITRSRLSEAIGLRVVAVSRAAANDYAKATGMDPRAISIVPPAINPDEVRRLASRGQTVVSDRCSVVACGSALYPAKGFDLWVEVCQATLRNAEFAGRFVWVGEEPRNLSGVAELVRGGQLLLTGVLDNPFPTLAAADIVVVPSRNEAFSRVVAEAMALGRPIVAFATGGIPEVLGDAGVLVEQGNIDAMAREVARLAGDADARRELGARAAHRADELNLLDDAQTRIRAVVKECLEDRPHHTMPIR